MYRSRSPVEDTTKLYILAPWALVVVLPFEVSGPYDSQNLFEQAKQRIRLVVESQGPPNLRIDDEILTEWKQLLRSRQPVIACSGGVWLEAYQDGQLTSKFLHLRPEDTYQVSLFSQPVTSHVTYRFQETVHKISQHYYSDNRQICLRDRQDNVLLEEQWDKFKKENEDESNIYFVVSLGFNLHVIDSEKRGRLPYNPSTLQVRRRPSSEL